MRLLEKLIAGLRFCGHCRKGLHPACEHRAACGECRESGARWRTFREQGVSIGRLAHINRNLGLQKSKPPAARQDRTTMLRSYMNLITSLRQLALAEQQRGTRKVLFG